MFFTSCSTKKCNGNTYFVRAYKQNCDFVIIIAVLIANIRIIVMSFKNMNLGVLVAKTGHHVIIYYFFRFRTYISHIMHCVCKKRSTK